MSFLLHFTKKRAVGTFPPYKTEAIFDLLKTMTQIQEFFSDFNYVTRYYSYAMSLPKYFLVKFPKLHRGLWAKRSVHSNFESHPGIFDYVLKAPKLVI